MRQPDTISQHLADFGMRDAHFRLAVAAEFRGAGRPTSSYANIVSSGDASFSARSSARRKVASSRPSGNESGNSIKREDTGSELAYLAQAPAGRGAPM